MLSRIRKSTYLKKFSALASGEMAAQGIQIAVIPILTRLYSPAIFGQYELFKSSALMLIVLSFLNYDLSIYSSNNVKERVNSIVLSVAILVFITCLTAIFLFFFTDFFVSVINSDIKEGWTWTLPLYVFLAALTNLMLIILTKEGAFYLIAKIKIVLSILIAAIQIIFGYMGMGYWGLLYSTLVVQSLAFLMYFFPFYKEFKSWAHEIEFHEIRSRFRRNWRLPLLVLPGNFLNNIAQVIPVFFLGRIDYSVLGYFSLARKVIDFPLKFVVASVQRLYVKELTDEVSETGKGDVTFKKNLKILSAIAVVLFLGVIIFTKPLLPKLFGEEWAPAIPFVIILSILFCFRFIFGGLSFVMVLGKAPKLDLWWQVLFCVLITSVFVFSEFFYLKPLSIISLYTFVGVCCYSIYGYISYKVSQSTKLLSNNSK